MPHAVQLLPQPVSTREDLVAGGDGTYGCHRRIRVTSGLETYEERVEAERCRVDGDKGLADERRGREGGGNRRTAGTSSQLMDDTAEGRQRRTDMPGHEEQ